MRQLRIMAGILSVWVVLIGTPRTALVHAQPVASKLVMSSVGTFTHSTRLFNIPTSEWQLQWRYSCKERDNFIVHVDARSGDVADFAVNELGRGGHGTEYMHQGGTFYLDIDSGCSWVIYVYAPSGGSLLPIHGTTMIMRDHGTGIHSSRLFRVPSEWQLRWSFNCRSSGGSGNFIVHVTKRSGDVQQYAVNELTTVDSGTEYMHQGGTFYLDITSECNWNVSVTQ